MNNITKEQLIDIIERAKNCLVCVPIADPYDIIENTMEILNEVECND